MPVGQAVMATMRVACAEAPALADAPSAAPAAASAVSCFLFFGFSALTTARISLTISSFVDAVRRASKKSLRTRARASLERICRWALPPPAGAAMRKTNWASPSGPEKSTPRERRAKARVGSVTASERQWGMATPPGTPVPALASRSMAGWARPATSVARPVSCTKVARLVITESTLSPKSASSATSSVVMRSDAMMEGSFSYRAEMEVWAVSSSSGRGNWVPGFAAAAVP